MLNHDGTIDTTRLSSDLRAYAAAGGTLTVESCGYCGLQWIAPLEWAEGYRRVSCAACAAREERKPVSWFHDSKRLGR